ncbi:5128_t:CDS:2, partial [Gigaspora rosea]
RIVINMGVSNIVKTYYHGVEGASIESFLYNYKSYAMSKSWDEATKCRMKIRDEDDDKARIKQLKLIMQSNDETIREYVNRFEAYIEPIKDTVRKDEKLDWFFEGLKDPVQKRVEFHFPKKYENARDWAIQVVNYKKKKDSRNVQKETNSKEEDERSIQKEIDELTAAFRSVDEGEKEKGQKFKPKGKCPFDMEKDLLQLEIRDVEGLFNVRAVKRKLDGLLKPTSKRSKVQETVIAVMMVRKVDMEPYMVDISFDAIIRCTNVEQEVGVRELEPVNEDELADNEGQIVYWNAIKEKENRFVDGLNPILARGH